MKKYAKSAEQKEYKNGFQEKFTMTSDLWKLHLICEKHNLSIDKLDLIFECIRQGIFNDDFSDDDGNGLTIAPVLQDVLDDLSDAGLIFRSVE